MPAICEMASKPSGARCGLTWLRADSGFLSTDRRTVLLISRNGASEVSRENCGRRRHHCRLDLPCRHPMRNTSQYTFIYAIAKLGW